jgi:hypothetical protein
LTCSRFFTRDFSPGKTESGSLKNYARPARKKGLFPEKENSPFFVDTAA